MNFNYDYPEKQPYKEREIDRIDAVMIFYHANYGKLTLMQAKTMIDNNFQNTKVPVKYFGAFLKGWFCVEQ